MEHIAFLLFHGSGACVKEQEDLPKSVLYGKGMLSAELDKLLDLESLTDFPITGSFYLVLEDKALEDIDEETDVLAFTKQDIAIRVAQALSNGNVDHRVLQVTNSVLVLGTQNKL